MIFRYFRLFRILSSDPAIAKSNNNVGEIDESYIFDVGQKWAVALEPICFCLFLLNLNDLC
jgi:hypothetical protein